MKIEYLAQYVTETDITIIWVEFSKVKTHEFSILDCYKNSNQLGTSEWDAGHTIIDEWGLYTELGYAYELMKEQDSGTTDLKNDKYMTLEILENHLKKTYPNEEIEII